MMRRRIRIRTTAVLSTLLLTGAVTLLPAQPSAAAPEGTRDIRTQILKKAIIGVAQASQGVCDNDDNNPAVGRLLNRLTDRLTKITPARTESEKLPEVAGGWKQVWSNLGGPSPVCNSAADIYQVVSPNGYYWNFAKTLPPSGQPGYFFLRGKYETTPDFLSIEFTNQAISPVAPPAGTNLAALSDRAESGEFIPLPPRPPVGVKGELKNVYVDDTLRIVRGTDNSGTTGPGTIFILVRADVLS